MASPGGGYSTKNPSVKRVLQEMKEMERETSPEYSACAMEDNIFEWHFTIRGPVGTPFEGGIYHGRILLPAEYPFKPPNIVWLTPNGRFEVGTKICLTISAHHPEYWQPSWSIRTALLALISFLPTPGEGALGALEYSDEERRELAKKSVQFSCPKCGPIANILPSAQHTHTEPGGEAHAPTSASAERQEELVPPAEQNNGLFNAPERANHEHPVNENPPQVLNQEENTQIAYLNLVIMGIAFAILAVLLKKATSMI